jgi:acetyltransferase-like isoleucine patch superfamily enzyme
MHEKIIAFIRSPAEKMLVMSHEEGIDILNCWYRFRSPVRLLLNSLVIRLAKLLPFGPKNLLFRAIGMKIGKNVAIAADVDFDPFFPELITIDDNSIVGWKSNILCHEITEDTVRLGRVHIKRNCLVGAFSSVRSAVTLGEGSILAMDSFANRDIPDNEIWGGVPAKYIKKVQAKRP